MAHHSPTPELSLDEERRQGLASYPFQDDWWFLLRTLDAQKPVAQIISLFDSDHLTDLLFYTPRAVVSILREFEPFLVLPLTSFLF